MSMTTELAQRMKAAALNATGAHERLSVMPEGDIFDISLAEGTQLDADITALNSFHDEATPANVLALVEALEAKQPHHNGMMQLSNELVMAKQRIAELEAREQGIKIAINKLVALAPRLDKRAVETLSMAVEQLRKGVRL